MHSQEVELEMWWQQVWEHSHGGSTVTGTSTQASAGEERAQGGGAANTIVRLGVPAEHGAKSSAVYSSLKVLQVLPLILNNKISKMKTGLFSRLSLLKRPL